MSRVPNGLTARCVLLVAAMGCPAVCTALAGQTPDASRSALDAAVAKLSLVRRTVQIGQPIWADFSICNPLDRPITLSFGEVDETANPAEPTVLPLEHVFSGPGLQALSAVSATDNSEQGWATSLSGVGTSAPPVTIAPYGILGVRVNLADYYPGLVQAGDFSLIWRPFGGALVSNRVELTVTQLKQAVIDTSLGNMTIAFEYEVAPKHVANFIELAESGFYNNKSFHLVIPGALIHGGCPRGDGTGVRPDGKMLKAEFSDLPHRAGTVSMSRKPNDPDSASCQFFICATRLRELDGKYTVLGHLVGQNSFDTLQKISQVETDDHDRPIDPVYIRQVRIVNAPVDNRDQYFSAPR